MNQPLQAAYTGYGEVTSVEQRNRVLRNTYWLLALSMVPTVLGAWIGVSTGLMRTMGVGMSAIVPLMIRPTTNIRIVPAMKLALFNRSRLRKERSPVVTVWTVNK